MGSLGFVDWHALHVRFCVLMWLVAGVLTVVVLGHLIAAPSGANAPTYIQIR
jgi:hypothetical protein